jgi:hypothetical protein
MAFSFLKNPLGAVLGVIRGVVDPFRRIREPVGSAIGAIGRGLAKLGADVEASAIRARVERERELADKAAGAANKSRTGGLSDADVPEATTKLRRKYSYTVRIESLDPATGKLVERFVTVSSDRLRNDEEIYGQATQGFAEGYGIQDAHITSITITGVKKAGAAGTL